MNQDKFLAERRGCIGGSDMGKILGLSKYGDALDVYLQKIGEVEDRGDDSPVIQRGNYLEPAAKQLFRDVTGRKVARQTRRIRHEKFPHVRCHIDGWVMPEEIQPTVRDDDAQKLSPVVLPLSMGVLETKIMSAGRFFEVRDYGLPDEYIVQLHTYIGATGKLWGCWFLLCPDPWEWLIVPVLSNPSLEQSLLQRGNRFWIDHVAKRKPPVPTQPEPIQLVRPAGRAIQRFDSEFADAVSLVLETSALIKRLELLRDDAKARLKEAMGAPGLVVTKTGRVTWTEVAGRRTLSKALLKANYPDVDISKCETIGQPYDMMRVTDRGSINEPGEEIRAMDKARAADITDDAKRVIDSAAAGNADAGSVVEGTAQGTPGVPGAERTGEAG